MSADGLKSLRAVVYVSGAGSHEKKLRQHMLELAKHSASFFFFGSDCFKHKRALVVISQSRYGDELCRLFGFPHGYFCALAKLLNYARCTFHVQGDSARVGRCVER